MRGRGSEGLGARNPVWFDLVEIYESMYQSYYTNNPAKYTLNLDHFNEFSVGISLDYLLKIDVFNELSVEKQQMNYLRVEVPCVGGRGIGRTWRARSSLV